MITPALQAALDELGRHVEAHQARLEQFRRAPKPTYPEFQHWSLRSMYKDALLRMRVAREAGQTRNYWYAARCAAEYRKTLMHNNRYRRSQA